MDRVRGGPVLLGPANVDENAGTHGPHWPDQTVRVAPEVELVNLRAGQDSGYFFLQPRWTR